MLRLHAEPGWVANIFLTGRDVGRLHGIAAGGEEGERAAADDASGALGNRSGAAQRPVAPLVATAASARWSAAVVAGRSYARRQATTPLRSRGRVLALPRLCKDSLLIQGRIFRIRRTAAAAGAAAPGGCQVDWQGDGAAIGERGSRSIRRRRTIGEVDATNGMASRAELLGGCAATGCGSRPARCLSLGEASIEAAAVAAAAREPLLLQPPPHGCRGRDVGGQRPVDVREAVASCARDLPARHLPCWRPVAGEPLLGSLQLVTIAVRQRGLCFRRQRLLQSRRAGPHSSARAGGAAAGAQATCRRAVSLGRRRGTAVVVAELGS
mmetsp:Transcript_8734/g.25010  ORF Transcript_8734/g.25010 Transcript_8734/m.25010 type:complete len:325 (-) Transcript_8734:132-1106(-)